MLDPSHTWIFLTHFHIVSSPLLPPQVIILFCSLLSSCHSFELAGLELCKGCDIVLEAENVWEVTNRLVMLSRNGLLSTRPQTALLQLYRSFVKSRIASRRFCFSIICFAVVLSKVVHIWAHFNSLPPAKLILWGLTFFAQDLALIYILRNLVQPAHLKPWRILDILGVTFAVATR